MATKQNTMTMRVSDELKAKLDRYARLSGRSCPILRRSGG